MTTIEIGTTAAGSSVALPLRLANRHGLVTGATGTGKTVTLQRLAEQFSAAGVPVFAADVKGDLSGVATAWPVAFWDIFGAHGLPIRTSVQDMGAQMLSSMLGLNAAQHGAMEICFRKSEDDHAYMLTLDDLRWSLNDMLEEREEVSKRYGNVTASSISAIQRNLLALEAQGGDHLFGEPPFDIADFMAIDAKGRGTINLLHADKLLEAPKLYATFLLWLLTELFRKLPEAGDLAKPKLVFFFDEAHLLFNDAPKPLLQQIERLVRLVRSKGVGVFFVTQSPTDVPSTVLEQLGTRILHAMRAHTAESLRKIRAAADTIRPRKSFKTREELPVLKIGEALVSVIGEDNVPSEVEKVKVSTPSGQLGPISDIERRALLESTSLRLKYHAGSADNAAAYAFNRRMMVARGIDPGPDTGVTAYDPNLYLKHVPSIDISAEPGKSVKRRLAAIAAWGAVAVLGLKVTGLV
ncbi:helicase HerA-like domain-containing protein [Mesorhizobium sp.]|uniref:helicase HerA-like domain-containing protein n=1 Tax=Mesorhizobium sp. TaxID=1871066 RepID=UPI0025EFB22C|nr:helicase HerA-like domain-containing protein [Mesorhizobium sp.]